MRRAFLTLTIRASNIENSLLVKSYYDSPVIDPDLSFELARESQETDPPTWVSLMYGISYHLDPQVVTVGERDTALANAINDIQSFWYDTDLETLAEMSSDEVFFKLNAIADDNSTNAIQLSIVKNYHIFLSSSMFGEKNKAVCNGKESLVRRLVADIILSKVHATADVLHSSGKSDFLPQAPFSMVLLLLSSDGYDKGETVLRPPLCLIETITGQAKISGRFTFIRLYDIIDK